MPSKSKRSKSPGSKKTRRVRIHSNHETRHYELDSNEKNMKRISSSRTSHLPKCGTGLYPCVKRSTIFENKAEWDDYLENEITRNISTGHKSVSAHRKSVMTHLSKKGKTAKLVPEEWRLYNVTTGEIIDMRSLDPKSLTYKPLK